MRTGRAGPLGSRGVISAIRKLSTDGRVKAGPLGLHGDQQADKRHHGGVDKAIHHYPAEHYNYWRNRFLAQLEAFRTGAFGENFSTLGLTEHSVCIGDTFRVGSATLQVSQARQPCWKLNVAFGIGDMARTVQESLRTGSGSCTTSATCDRAVGTAGVLANVNNEGGAICIEQGQRARR